MSDVQVCRGLALAIAIGVCTSYGVAAAQERWASYTNPRFGTTAEYPVDLFTVQDPPPENGDGQSFRTPDGRAQLSIYGANNAGDDTPQDYVAKYVDLEGATFKRVTSEFYVVSGTRGGNIYYERCNFPPGNDGALNCIHLSYPAQEKAEWDAVVTRISQSLRPGPG